MADFVGLFNPSQLDPLQQQRMGAQSLAQMSPQQMVAYSRIRGGQMLGEGAGNAVRLGVGAATGADVRTKQEKLSAIQAQLQQMIQSGQLNPQDRKAVLRATVQLLSQAGLVAEAQQVAAELDNVEKSAFDQGIKEREMARKEGDTKGRLAALQGRLELAQRAAGETDRLLAAYADTAEQLERGDFFDEAEKARAQAVLRALGAKLGVKPTKDAGGVWRVSTIPNSKYGAGKVVKYNTQTGETTVEDLGGRQEGGAGGGAGGGGGADQPVSKPTELKGQVDDDGKQLYVDKAGNQWVLDGKGGWAKANSGSRDTRDRALPAQAQKKLMANDALIVQIDMILNLMRSPKARSALGVKAYANRIFDSYDRLDTAGVPLRSQITNLMSAKLHERSGAAVTVQEFDRLRGFLPQPTDSYQVAYNKLRSMRQVAIAETNSYRESQSAPAKSYPAPPGLGSASSAQPASSGGLPPGVTVRVKGS